MSLHQKFLVKILAKQGSSVVSKPAMFGHCLLDQLVEQKLLLDLDAERSSICNDHTDRTADKKYRQEGGRESPNGASLKLCRTSECYSRHISYVNYSLGDSSLTLAEVPPCSKISHILRHAEFCPARLQHQQDGADDTSLENRSTQSIVVGVSVLTQSADGKVLLTRRARHMRTFPGVWVPPGGHVEVGENLEAAGARELLEETGIALLHDQPVQVLGMWESVYPPVLAFGSPVRHHLVVYLLASLPLPSHDVRLKLQAKEVDAGVWLDAKQVAVIVHGPTDDTPVLPETISGLVIDEHGETVAGDVETSRFLQLPVTGAADYSRLSTGSKYALSLWLSRRQPARDSGRLQSPPLASL